MTVAVAEFSAHSFEFRFEVASPIVLNQHKGSALRGALFHSLRKVGCSRQELTSCHPCPLLEVCPISFLLATVDEEGKRGGDVPRPFVINPPLDGKNIYQPGDTFTFGLTLFAQSVKFLPYLVVALQHLEKEGLGAKSEHTPGKWQRGTLKLQEILALNPLSGEEQSLFKLGSRSIAAPTIAASQSQVLKLATSSQLSPVRILHFTFHTPTRLIAEGKPLSHPDMVILVQRLVERLSSLSKEYASEELQLDFDRVIAEAREVVLYQDRTRWEQVRSYSNRQHQDLSLAGFTGEVSYIGRVDNLLPLLLWGQISHVGKDATKGNGWYSLKFSEILDE